MITNFTSPSRKRRSILIIIALLVAVGLGAFFMINQSRQASKPLEYPLYLNFAGGYVFSVPKEYSVDEQSVPGIQLVYSGTYTVKTLADIYDSGGMSAQALTELKDTNFKEYINKTFVPNLKKDLSTDDVQTKYQKDGKWDTAHITAKKDGKAFRYVYLKNGQHPAALIAKQESAPLKKIAETMRDVEDSPLKGEVDPIKASIKDVLQLAREQKAAELYALSGDGIRTKNSQEDLAKALKASAEYTNGDVVIVGGSYDDKQFFSVAIRFTKLNKEDQKPGIGSMTLKKNGNQWKLEQLGLPSPEQPQQ